MNKWILRLICAAVLLALCLPLSVAASAATIDNEKDASLTLVYQYDGVAYADLDIRTFRVADIAEDFSFTLSGQFAEYPVSLYGISSQAEWNVICQTLQAYVWADSLKPTASAVTDESGTVKFEKLTPGIYLTMPITHLAENFTTEFFGFLTVIPNPEDDGGLNYDVTAYPKSTQYDPEDGNSRNLRVVKQWKDSGFEEFRPKSVKVDIYRNGEFKSTVRLSAENNWSYGWTTEDDGAVWTAVEREIPPEYTVTIETKEDTFVLTNVRKGDDGPPDSGDTTVLWPYVMGMCLSGCVVILLAVSRKKKGYA